MSASTVRISDSSRRALRDLAERERVPMQAVLDRAIETYRRQRFLAAVNQTFAELRADHEAWAAETAERAEWDKTTGDDTDGD